MHGLQVTSFDKIWGPSVTNEQCSQLSVADTSEDCRVVDLVTVEMENRENCSILALLNWRKRDHLPAPSVIGFKNFVLCQLVARGPVSASPSPTMVKAMRFGLSKTAPKA